MILEIYGSTVDIKTSYFEISAFVQLQMKKYG